MTYENVNDYQAKAATLAKPELNEYYFALRT